MAIHLSKNEEEEYTLPKKVMDELGLEKEWLQTEEAKGVLLDLEYITTKRHGSMTRVVMKSYGVKRSEMWQRHGLRGCVPRTQRSIRLNWRILWRSLASMATSASCLSTMNFTTMTTGRHEWRCA